MRKIEIFINSIDPFFNEPNRFIFKGDGHGDFEIICDSVANKKILEDYVEYLETQLQYVNTCIENYKE